MIERNFNPDYYSPPGNTILRILNRKRSSKADLAKELNTSSSYIDGLISGRAELTKEVAVKLQKSIGGSWEFWMERELQYRNEKIRIDNDRLKSWIKALPISDMKKFGWIKKEGNVTEECLNFFNLKEISEWNKYCDKSFDKTVFRTSYAFEPKIGSVAAWLRLAEIRAEQMECKVWNEDKFVSTLEEIKPLSRKKNPSQFLPDLIKQCAECGVAVVVAPTPRGCQASGATRFLSSKKALLVLSFRYLSDDQFWFTFFHESGHLVLHGKQKMFLEGLERPDYSEEQMELDANNFAGEMLIPYQMRDELKTLRSNKRKILGFAQKVGVSPGIVVGQMQFHGLVKPMYLNAYKRRYKWEEIYKALEM
jgi:plasmid maintenance system antidote protein VapI